MPILFESLRSTHRHLLADEREYENYVGEANARAQELGLVQLPKPAADELLRDAPSVLSLAAWQTAFRNQLDRGSCYAFAACAAMEAAYRREFALVLDLSEHYVFYINKVTALLSDWQTSSAAIENNSTLTGFQGSSDIVDKLARFAAVEEWVAPYLTNATLTAIRNSLPTVGTMTSQAQSDAFEFNAAVLPPAAHKAGRYQVESFAALPANPTVEQVKQVLAHGYEVVVDIPGHCFLIVGYDDAQQSFEVKNSWGENTFIRYAYTSPILGGRYITKVRAVSSPQPEAAWLGFWKMDHDGWLGDLTIRRFTNFDRPDAESTKLGDYYREGRRYDVNGRVSPDGSTMTFWVADTTDRTLPGAAVGQRFVVQFCEGDLDAAAGVTTFDGVDYGVRLGRQLSSQGALSQFSVDRWIDSWSIRRGGRADILRIWSTKPLEGRYERDGLTYDITGNVDPETDHNLRFRTSFSSAGSTTYELFHHTWEDGVVSGYCRPPGNAFGVQAVRYNEPKYPPFAPPGPGAMASFIYAIAPSGNLEWYRHDGARNGTYDWKGARTVGRGWDGLRAVIPGGGDVLYAVTPEGELLWYRHLQFNTGAGLRDPGSWAGRAVVNHGFDKYVKLFSGGGGIIYGITEAGQLIWNRHYAVGSGGSIEQSGMWSDPKSVGRGWDPNLTTFSVGHGIIYIIDAKGQLLWYNHLGYLQGLGLHEPGSWSPLSGKPVGRGWGEFTEVFGRGEGVIYGVQSNGVLTWFRHLGYLKGGGLQDSGSWQGGTNVGTGWQSFNSLFALLPGIPKPIN